MKSVYVASAGRGVKVGISRNYVARLKQIAAAIGQPVALNFITDPLDNAAAVEALAHWKLREHHTGAEWFSCDAATAWGAVKSSVGGVERGEAPERRVGNATPFADLKDVRISFDLPADMVAAVDEWRRWLPRIPSRSEAIRRLVSQQIDSERQRTKA